jgi:hypothetical protein
MASAADIDDLPGQTLSDQDGRKIGEIKEVCDNSGDRAPMWVSVEASFTLMKKRHVLVPVARIKEERGQFLVPYSIHHIEGSPEIEASGELSAQDDRRLRDHYGIDRADAELRTDNDSYATQVQDGPGTPPEEAYTLKDESSPNDSS